MADNNIIKPVEGLQNIGALTPVQQRNKKRPKQNKNQQSNEEEANHDEIILNELTDEQDLNDEINEGKNQLAEDSEDLNHDSTSIDYRA